MHEQISQVEKSIIWALNLLIDHSKKKCAKWAHRNCSSIHKTWTGSSHMEVKVDTASTSNQEVTIIWYQAGKGKTSFSQWSVCKCFCSDGKVSWNSDTQEPGNTQLWGVTVTVSQGKCILRLRSSGNLNSEDVSSAEALQLPEEASPAGLRSSGPHPVARLAVQSSLLLFFSASSTESLRQ